MPSQNQATAGTSIGVLNLGSTCASQANVVYGLSKIAPYVPASFYPPRIDVPVAGVTPLTCDPTDTGEPDLDLQTVIPLVYPMKTYQFQAGDYSDSGLFGAVQNMGQNGIPRPDVLSVSWGGTEDDLSYALSICAQSKSIFEDLYADHQPMRSLPRARHLWRRPATLATRTSSTPLCARTG